MCTGFIKKGDDVIFGFNMDLPDGAWDFRVYPKKDMFYVGIRVKEKVYRAHGVNARGQFANLPYMNAPERGAYRRGKGVQRLDLLVDGYIAGKLAYQDVAAAAETRAIVNAPDCSMHALFGDAEGHMLLVEPGFRAARLTGDFSVISNFPILENPENLKPENLGWYGLDRYQRAEDLLRQAEGAFGLDGGMRVLEAVSQTGNAPTRVSFVYSVRSHTVRYALERNFREAKEYHLT